MFLALVVVILFLWTIWPTVLMITTAVIYGGRLRWVVRWERREAKQKARKSRMRVHGLRYLRTVTTVIAKKADKEKEKMKRKKKG